MLRFQEKLEKKEIEDKLWLIFRKNNIHGTVKGRIIKGKYS